MPMTSSPSLKRLLRQLKNDFPHYAFQQGAIYRWSPETKTITWAILPGKQAVSDLLHELAHAELGHTGYHLDIELIRYEGAAWQYARDTLAPAYNVLVATDYLESSLESYRAWLYARSLCSACSQIGLQTTRNTYSCINCKYSWHANDARQCGLRRGPIASP